MSTLDRVRAICLSLPEVQERPSHGAPAWFIKGKQCFCMFVDNHHGDGIVGVWCAAPPGVQAELIEKKPTIYFRPPYVGTSGWVGVRLDRKIGEAEIRRVLTDAFMTRAPAKLRDSLLG
jgi:hypothetical protein